MGSKALTFLTGFCFCLILACGAAAQKVIVAAPDPLPAIFGKFDGRRYSNKVLNFELQLPRAGVIVNRSEMEVYKTAGIDSLKNEDARHNELIDAAVQKEAIILDYARKPLGTPGNPVLIIGALKQDERVTAAMVVDGTSRGLSASGRFTVTRSLNGFAIGGLKADGLEGVFETKAGVRVKERILVLMRNGYSICFTMTAVDDEGITSVQAVLDPIKFFAQ